ncbi:MAG TPA: hypothetical protein VJV79_21430 [Polyangiaceae bacterium]|nr:hypothetical protein [Polyangiaceae bacterium]
MGSRELGDGGGNNPVEALLGPCGAAEGGGPSGSVGGGEFDWLIVP